MERRRDIPDYEILDAEGIQAWDEFFPTELFGKLIKFGFSLPDRKTRYSLSDGIQFPPLLSEASALVATTFNLDPRQINTIVVKRYASGESSDAFKAHQDPEEFEGGLFVGSLSGKAVFETGATIYRRMKPVECIPNRLIAMQSDNWHRVSEPDPKFGTRLMIFFGHNCSSPDKYPREIPLNWWVD